MAVAMLVFGLVLGGIIGVQKSESGIIMQSLLLQNDMRTLGIEHFFEALLKHGKYFAAIILLVNVPYGFILSGFVIGIKGFVNGYTTGLFIKLFGFAGIKYAALLYLPQNVLTCVGLVYIMIFVARKRNKGKDFATASAGVLLKCVVILVFASLIEWKLVNLMSHFV